MLKKLQKLSCNSRCFNIEYAHKLESWSLTIMALFMNIDSSSVIWKKVILNIFVQFFFLKFELKSWYADIFLLYYKIGCTPFLEHNCSFCSLDQGKRYYFAIIHYMCCFHLLMFIPVISDVCVTF